MDKTTGKLRPSDYYSTHCVPAQQNSSRFSPDRNAGDLMFQQEDEECTTVLDFLHESFLLVV